MSDTDPLLGLFFFEDRDESYIFGELFARLVINAISAASTKSPKQKTR